MRVLGVGEGKGCTGMCQLGKDNSWMLPCLIEWPKAVLTSKQNGICFELTSLTKMLTLLCSQWIQCYHMLFVFGFGCCCCFCFFPHRKFLLTVIPDCVKSDLVRATNWKGRLECTCKNKHWTVTINSFHHLYLHWDKNIETAEDSTDRRRK